MPFPDVPSVSNHLAEVELTELTRIYCVLREVVNTHQDGTSKYGWSCKEIENHCVFIAGSWFAVGPGW